MCLVLGRFHQETPTHQAGTVHFPAPSPLPPVSSSLKICMDLPVLEVSSLWFFFDIIFFLLCRKNLFITVLIVTVITANWEMLTLLNECKISYKFWSLQSGYEPVEVFPDYSVEQIFYCFLALLG